MSLSNQKFGPVLSIVFLTAVKSAFLLPSHSASSRSLSPHFLDASTLMDAGVSGMHEICTTEFSFAVHTRSRTDSWREVRKREIGNL